MAFRAAAIVLAATALLLLPAAGAHTPAYSADNKVKASIGLLNEPVVVDATSGADICFTSNDAAGTPIPIVDAFGKRNNTLANHFKVELVAPSGQRFTEDVQVQFAKTHCITFLHPQVLSQPGQYVIDLTMQGALQFNGTTFNALGIKAGGAVQERGNVTFPDADVPSAQALQDKVAALEARIGALESDLAAAQARADEEKKDDAGQFASGAPAALLMVGLAAFVALRRRA